MDSICQYPIIKVVLFSDFILNNVYLYIVTAKSLNETISMELLNSSKALSSSRFKSLKTIINFKYGRSFKLFTIFISLSNLSTNMALISAKQREYYIFYRFM